MKICSWQLAVAVLLNEGLLLVSKHRAWTRLQRLSLLGLDGSVRFAHCECHVPLLYFLDR